jgi:hypothetical protein
VLAAINEHRPPGRPASAATSRTWWMPAAEDHQRFAIAERTHNMTSIEHGNDAGLADFLAKLDWANTSEPVTFGWAVIGLTNFGERPLEITRLAEVLDMPASEAEEHRQP